MTRARKNASTIIKDETDVRHILREIQTCCRVLDESLLALKQESRETLTHLELRLEKLEQHMAEIQSELIDGGDERPEAVRATHH